VPDARRSFSLTPFDGLLLLMVTIWGANYTVVKVAFREMPYLAFNATRLVVASLAFVAVLGRDGWPRLTRRDWLQLAALGAIGHFIYQLLFMGGLSRTTVSNSALVVGCSPVVTSLVSAWVGHERVQKAQWAGVALSMAGVYLVVGRGAELHGAHLVGDLLMLGAVCCWAVYTVGSRSLLTRMPPLVVTGLSTILGTLMYAPIALPDLARTPWPALSPGVWAAILYASILSLNVSYLIWYTSVLRIGNVRTSAWSNLIPLIAIAIAALVLGERVTGATLAGAAAILSGVTLTRLASRAKVEPPAEE
jgi:drug/metabolite transporter (DMT)-like permease